MIRIMKREYKDLMEGFNTDGKEFKVLYNASINNNIDLLKLAEKHKTIIKTDKKSGDKYIKDIIEVSYTMRTEKYNCYELRELSYKNGFNIDGVHFVRYKRSDGSARQGKCLFIKEGLYKEIMKWSFCGIDIKKDIDLAGFEAYISKTLSDCISTFRLNMKNEFFYLRMILTSRKKSYCGLIRLREGKELIPEKPDNKGLQFIKSTAAPETKEYFKKLTKDILYKKNISTTYVLSKVKEFGDFIENDINQGNKTFLNPLSVKDPEAYEKPFRNQGIRGVYVWNCVYPDMQIDLPDKVTIAKVKMETRDEILKLKCIDSEIYEVLMKSVFDNYDCPFRDKGISVIAIPSNIDSVPEWIRYFIDKDKIVNDNLSKFYMIMESLGIKLLDTRSNDTHYSNIVSF